jgi:hypothetical protein
MKSISLAILVAAAVAGCAKPPAARMAEPERTSLTVRVPGPLSSAFSRLQAAWIQSGLVVGTSDAAGGNISSPPQRIEASMGLITSDIVYRANSVTVGDSVDIILSATSKLQSSGGQHNEEAVSSRARGPFVQVWDKLETVAAGLRR